MSSSRRTAEPFIWLGFSAGGMVAALAIPALLFLFGIAIPLGWLDAPDYDKIHGLLTNPLTRLVLLALCGLSLIHFAHRLRFALLDGLQIRRYDPIIATACYGLALVGAAVATWLLVIAT